jgi:hypothetical protein
VSKIEKILQFHPTDTNCAIKETVEFYNEAYAKFPNERKSIEKAVKKILKTDEEKDLFHKFIKTM